MATHNIGDKVLLPATIMSIQQDESGTYFELKIKTNNKINTLHCEEEDIVVPETTTTTPSETTPTETNTTENTTTEP